MEKSKKLHILQDEEIDLCEIIIRHKKTIIAFSCFYISIAALGILFFSFFFHEAVSTVKIGILEHPLLTNEEAVEILNKPETLDSAMSILGIIGGEGFLRNRLTVENVNNTYLIRIRIKDFNRLRALKICGMLTDYFISTQNEAFNKKFSLLKEQLKEIEIRVEEIKDQKEKINNEILLIKPKAGLLREKVPDLLGFEILYSNGQIQKSILKNTLLKSNRFLVFDMPHIVNNYGKQDKIIIAALNIIFIGLFLVVGLIFIREVRNSYGVKR